MNISDVIKKRRSIDPDNFNGKIVEENIINEMLEAANWAPTHGFTEPWRFVVFAKDKAKAFGQMHADLYKTLTPADQFLQKKYDKLKNRPNLTSHVIVCVNKRGDKSNIPELEEIAATSCAIQNMLLVAADNNVGTFWSTGGMCYTDEMRETLGFEKQDQVLGFIFVGHYDIANPEGKRTTSIEEKTKWM
ncbi:MAG: nitroreductase [Chitinophagales bacterium]